MFEGTMLGVAIYAAVAGWPWWSAPLIGVAAGVGAWSRQLRSRARSWLGPPQPAVGVVVVFGWAGLIAAIYLLTKVMARAAI